jgi:NADH-quinone oxidoreductase subunit F
VTTIISQDVASTFQAIKEHALSRWKELWDGEKPVIMVSTATCGSSAGALEVLKTIREELGKEQDGVRVIEVGCMGHCYAEPTVTIAKPGNPPIVYGYITPEKASRLIKDYVRGNDASPEFALGALKETELIPSIYDMPRFKYEKYVILQNIGIDPEDIDHYIAKGGYEALAKSLQMQIRTQGEGRRGILHSTKVGGLPQLTRQG